MFKTIVVPLDGSLLAESALPIVADIATCSNGEVVLMRCAGDIMIDEILMPQELEDIQARITHDCHVYLENMATKLRANGIATTILVAKGDPASQILEVIGIAKADAIVMATHGLGGLRRLVVGSVADRVLHHADVAVILVRPDESKLQGAETDAKSSNQQQKPTEVF